VNDFLAFVFSEKGMRLGFFVCLSLAAWWVLFIVFLRWRTIVASGAKVHSRLTDRTVRAQISSLFTFSGRLDRKQYLVTLFASAFGYVVFWFLGFWLFDFGETVTNALGVVMVATGTVLWFWINCAASAKRTRDTGVTVWWALALLIPPVNLAATIFLFFVPTDEFAGRGL
jgi:uncharacterized membrane protein YhaH (DUF805 family)